MVLNRLRQPLRVETIRIIAAAVGAAVTVAISTVTIRALSPTPSRSGDCPEDADAVDVDLLLRCGRRLYSQGNEELIIRHFFRDRRGGVFLDVGSGHYMTGSTTYYLEHLLGWTGIAVDAQAEYGPDYATYRPGARFFSYLVTDHSGTIEPFYRLSRLPQMSSASKAWAENAAHAPAEVVPRPTIQLNDLLAQAGVAKIDFLSMDIETGEPAALAGFDIGKYRPDLICIEMADTVREKIDAYFAGHAYERIHYYDALDHVNGYFQPAGRD